ncbi:MAG: diacylglycerol kinase family protein [Bryobacterales bacterium]|nr:diacylglycerol kinase family protein [Bryobacterales bacterium]
MYNPRAGAFQRAGAERIEGALAALRAAGHTVQAQPTTGPGTAGEIARESIERGADLILAAGGDGTVNETLNGMAGSATPLAVLPAGTANCLGHELGLGKNLERVAGRIGEFEPVRLALGLLRASDTAPRHFLMFAGAGLDARVIAEMDFDFKRRTGKFAYWVIAFRLVGKRLAEFDVRAGDITRRCGFALAARVRNYGGDLKIARGASLLRPDFETVLMQGATAGRYLKYLLGVGTGTLGRMRGATVHAASSIELIAPGGEPVPVQVDGELAGTLPATVEIVDDALTLLVPPEYLAGERSRVGLK